MSEALFLTFQSQLSVVMETVLKSAMFEITRLVEDSFLEEVGHRKQEVEVLRRRLQLSESKLRQKEYEQGRKIHCLDCGCCRKGASSNKDTQSVETIHGPSLRDPSTNEPPLTQPVLRQQTRLQPESKIHTAHSHSKDKHEVHRQSVTDITTPNSNIQIPQDVLQRLLGNAPVQSESTSEAKPRVRDKSEKDCTLDKDMSSNHSRLLHGPLAQEALEPSSPKKIKSETEPKLLPVKEEEEMVPVWEGVNRDDVCHGEMADPSHGELSGSCDQEEIQCCLSGRENNQPCAIPKAFLPGQTQDARRTNPCRKISPLHPLWENFCQSM
ncbi:uncharacterized protein si:ch73-109d9.1 isoform X3 [Triplophysa rosa]|uniref:uncharacterized protein si:ch73-109d9.1 isoform X3 n=1 Tax=Triplophysa rosa TaxID=992332 RepID=UPI0025462D3D|nr:uncharacterized protein si:ch73-109d9.1 isoform X3 [Triplophysa rosa]